MEGNEAHGWPLKTRAAEFTGLENSLPDVLKVLIIAYTVRAGGT